MTGSVPPKPGPLGETTLQVVVDEQKTSVAGFGPKYTLVEPVAVEKLLPDIVTKVPPRTDPVFGLIAPTKGVKAVTESA